MLAASARPNYSFREKNLTRTGELSFAVPVERSGGAILEGIHLYLCFPDVDRATDRFGG
jgi:hypothetical protein